MAFRPTKDSTPPAKEKRGTSPSTTTTRGRSPNPPGKDKRGTSPSNVPATSARGRSPPNPSPSKKPVPNYLKPTISMQQGKKLVLKIDETTQDPALLRRRSFDKPPSTAQLQRSRVSPGPALRSSSSFSGKITSPGRSKEVGKLKQPALYARPVNAVKKSSTVSIKKKDNSSKAKEKNVAPPNKVDEQENQDSISYEHSGGENEQATEDKGGESTTFETSNEQGEGEEAIMESSAINLEGVKDSPVEDQELINIVQTEGDSENTDTEIVNSELLGNSEHQNEEKETIAESLEAPEEAQDATQEESNEDDSINETKKAINSEEKQEEPNEEDIISETKNAIDSDEKQEESNEEDIINETNNTVGNIKEEVEGKEEMGSSKEDEPASGEGVCETKEKDVQQVEVEKEPESPEVQMAHGKNDVPVSNNDVIEETASKLREQRRNKVRALAGAFESAISMQEK